MLFLLLACNNGPGKDSESPPPHESTPLVEEQGYCAVLTVLDDACTTCHSAGDSPSGDLNLATDPHAATVGVASVGYPGQVLVVPGDPDSSLLFLKMTDGSGTWGGIMPPAGALGAEKIVVIRNWIVDGASEACDDPDSGGRDPYHPDGWEDPANHGMAAKLSEDDCVSCHGTDLGGGGTGVSCDDCHEEGWRTNCTFCHGGTDNSTGAPPVDIRNGQSNVMTAAHTAHVEGTIHAPFDCVQCHKKPTDVLSSGHFLVSDSSPAVSEVLFTAGLSPAASWSGSGCSNLYCHGNGQGNNGSIQAGGRVACGGCHAVTSSGQDAWDRMSGEHKKHLEAGFACSECHGGTVNAAEQLSNVALHVNGQVDIVTNAAISYNGSCSGTCHGTEHRSEHF
jgi:Planctomycete cytochrome C